MDADILDIILVAAAVAAALAAAVAAIRAGRAEHGLAQMSLDVNSRLDDLIAGARASGELKGRLDEEEAEFRRDERQDEIDGRKP